MNLAQQVASIAGVVTRLVAMVPDSKKKDIPQAQPPVATMPPAMPTPSQPAGRMAPFGRQKETPPAGRRSRSREAK
eukprot:12887935-Prorocentrum_lima.AAC.1